MSHPDVQSLINKIPYAKHLGIRPSVLGDELTLIMPYRDESVGNPLLPALHGGAMGAFLEITAVIELQFRGYCDGFPKTIDVNMDFLRRAKPTDLFARAVIARQGSRVANVRVKAWQATRDEPIIILHGHFLTRGDD